MARVDPELFSWSWDFVGDLAETVALIWPETEKDFDLRFHREPHFDPRRKQARKSLDLSSTRQLCSGQYRGKVQQLIQSASSQIAREGWGGDWRLRCSSLQRDGRDAAECIAHRGGRSSRALARSARCDRSLGTVEAASPAALRIGVSARLAETRARRVERRRYRQDRGGLARSASLPTLTLFAWLEGRATIPDTSALPTLLPVDAGEHHLRKAISTSSIPRDYLAEWKWDGIRVQLVGARRPEAALFALWRRYRRGHFRTCVETLPDAVTLDGELLVIRDGEVAPFNDLQQRLNRKIADSETASCVPGSSAALRPAARGPGGSARFAVRRTPPAARSLVRVRSGPRLDLSLLLHSAAGRNSRALRAAAARARIEGIMLKRRIRSMSPAARKGRGSNGSGTR